MALTLTIDGNNRTSVLVEGSLRIEQRADSFVSTCTFQIIDEDADITIAAKDVVVAEDGGSKYFEGTVANVKSDNFAEGEESLVHTVECQDYNLRLEEVIIDDVELWEAKRDDVIIDECFDEYLPEINTHPVGGGGYVDHLHVFAEFSVYQVSMREFMDQVCQQSEGPALVGYWYVDYDKNLHYFHAEADVSAWWLSDTPDDVDSFAYVSAVKRDRQGSAIINRVLVVGADTALFVQDDASVALYGNLEAVIRDQNLITVDEMTDRGYEFLDKWANEQITYTVTTRKTTDLRAGMDIRFINTLFGVDDTFTIKQLIISWPEDTITFELTLGGVVAYSTLVRDRVDADRPRKVVLEVDQVPLSSRGWSHNLVFSALDADTVQWAAGTIYTADSREFAIAPGANTGNMTADTTNYIYLDIDVSETALQVTEVGPTYGRNIILVAVAYASAAQIADGKDPMFQVFGGEGQGVFITADSIAADTITANEIAANTITAAEIAAATITATEIAANTIKTTNLSIGGFGDFLFRSTDLLLLGPSGRLTVDDAGVTGEWYSTRQPVAALSGAIHQEQGRWLGSRGLVFERTATNLLINPSFETNVTGWTAGGGSAISQSGDFARYGDYSMKITQTDAAGSTYLTVVVNPVQATIYTATVWVKGSVAGQSIGESATLYLTEIGGAQPQASTTLLVTLTSDWQWIRVTHTIQENDRTGLRLLVNHSGTAAAHYMYLDGVQCEESDYYTSYLDGSLGTGYAWTGAAHASTSTRTRTEANLDEYVDLIDGNTAFSMRAVAQAGYDSDDDLPRSSLVLWAARGADNNNYIYAAYSEGADYFFLYINGAVRAQSAVQSFSKGDWFDIVVTFDFTADDYNLYVNGELADNDTTVLAPPTLTDWQVGDTYTPSSYHWGGTICEYAVFDRVLTAEEVAGMYELHRPLVDVGSAATPGIYILDGMFYIASSTSGNRIEITSESIAGYAGATKQFYIQASDGKAYAGAGAVVLDADGITITAGLLDKNNIKWLDSGNQTTAIYSFLSGISCFFEVQTGRDNLDATAAIQLTCLTQLANRDVAITLLSGSSAGDNDNISFEFAGDSQMYRWKRTEVRFKQDLYMDDTSDVRIEGGLAVGSLANDPATGDALIAGGLAIGTTSNPGTGSIKMTGGIAVGCTTAAIAGAVIAAGGVMVGGTANPVAGTIEFDTSGAAGNAYSLRRNGIHIEWYDGFSWVRLDT